MKKTSLFLVIIITLFTVTLSSCQVIGGIFKAGVLSGIIIVIAVIALIAYLLTRGGRNSE
ncbi:MAG TPA: hypothetical protein VK705_05895 [Ferruginibacter sp.]|nr:hypothetical protein [Ferruginibacter sp.]